MRGPAKHMVHGEWMTVGEAAVRLGMKGVQMARTEFMPARLWDGPVAHDFEELNRLLETGAIF